MMAEETGVGTEVETEVVVIELAAVPKCCAQLLGDLASRRGVVVSRGSRSIVATQHTMNDYGIPFHDHFLPAIHPARSKFCRAAAGLPAPGVDFWTSSNSAFVSSSTVRVAILAIIFSYR